MASSMYVESASEAILSLEQCHVPYLRTVKLVLGPLYLHQAQSLEYC